MKESLSFPLPMIGRRKETPYFQGSATYYLYRSSYLDNFILLPGLSCNPQCLKAGLSNNNTEREVPHTVFRQDRYAAREKIIMNIQKLTSIFKDCPWATHILELDKGNKMYLEGIGQKSTGNYRLRISWVSATDSNSFDEMMNFIEVYAKENGYNNLYFADMLSEDILGWFLSKGFTENEVNDENHYLIKDLNNQ